MDFNSRRLRPDEDASGGGLAGAPLPSCAPEDIFCLREIARAGGGRHHVKAKNLTPGSLRALRVQGLVELLSDCQGHVAAKLTVRGLQALAAVPCLLSR